MATIELKGIEKSFGSVHVIKGIDLKIESGEFATFVGPSGCGKSTLLRLIAGLESIDEGELLLDGRPMNNVAPNLRGIAMVFQNYALYPHMTAAQNIGFSLDLKKTPKPEIQRQVAEVAEILQISELLDRRPGELSGGQRQRVAIGRAIIKKPAVVLFDEPLSNLDAALRVQMRSELLRLHRAVGGTMIYVTHDQVEAMTMADRMTVLYGGKVEQSADPITLYRHPANTFVATFIGSPKMNLFPATVSRNGDGSLMAVTNWGWRVPLPDQLPLEDKTRLQVGIRPEHFSLAHQDGGLEVEVTLVERLGVETHLSATARGVPIAVRVNGDIELSAGGRVSLVAAPDQIKLFDESGSAILNG